MGPLASLYRRVRAATERLADPLTVEDQVVQSLPEASPVKWHLAHTSWFFETFVLAEHAPDYRPLDSRHRALFNSYYNAVGEPPLRAARGTLSRPTVDEVRAYRRHVDEAMHPLLDNPSLEERLSFSIELGINHEEQHQELILTDVKHALAVNPLEPLYRKGSARSVIESTALQFIERTGGALEIGHSGNGFSFDNERPRHRVQLAPFSIANRLVTNSEYLAFIEDNGYSRPELWLSDGWEIRRREGWEHPLYWRFIDGQWTEMTLCGRQSLDPAAPVCHVSHYEADAYATWMNARLPLESEWESVAAQCPIRGNLLEQDLLHPSPFQRGDAPIGQLFGDAWEWTGSAYLPYPGYARARFRGSLGEYNGKFMSGQLVLRGGSCATPARHLRATYRNFFPPNARWQFTGIRLARDLD